MCLLTYVRGHRNSYVGGTDGSLRHIGWGWGGRWYCDLKVHLVGGADGTVKYIWWEGQLAL